MPVAYCDFIINQIKHTLQEALDNYDVYSNAVGDVKYDLHPEEGYMLSTKKVLEYTFHGKKYNITVEEA